MSQADRDALVRYLEACRAFKDANTRASVIQRLPKPIPHRFAASGEVHLDATRLIELCDEYAGGLGALRDALDWFEDGSDAMHAFDALLARIDPGAAAKSPTPGPAGPGSGASGAPEAVRVPSTTSTADLVTKLIDLLSQKRQAPQGSSRRAELTEDIDARVTRIKKRFQPTENTVVAGARLRKVIGTGNFGTVWESWKRASAWQSRYSGSSA